MEHVVAILGKLNEIGGPLFTAVVILLVLPDGREWVKARLGIKPDNKRDRVPSRINGTPCHLHEGLEADLHDIKVAGDRHHEEQQTGINRIHDRIDEIFSCLREDEQTLRRHERMIGRLEGAADRVDDDTKGYT